MDAVENILLRRLANVCGQPRSNDVVAFLTEYDNATRHTSPEVLNAAATDLIHNQMKDRYWPPIAQCIAAVKKAEKEVAANAVGLAPIANFDAWHNSILDAIRKAENEMAITAQLAKLEPYVEAKWCFKSRLADAIDVAAERATELQIQNARNFAGPQ